MGDLDGRTYVVTGGNTGIGRATAAGLASRGAQVYLACRSAGKGQAAAAAITAATGNHAVGVLPLDLARLDSVRGCAAAFRALGQPLHGLINNAGLTGRRGRSTADGFELAFGVDHLGHFALTMALLDGLTASAPARVVTVSSDAHYQAAGIDFDAVRRPGRSITGLPEYAVAKLCNVLFGQELARRLAGTGVTSYVLHPGVVASDIWRRVPWPVRPLLTRRMLSTEEGARTSLLCATDERVAAASGRYYEVGQEREPSPVATAELAAELWRRSEAWTAQPAGR
jgi:NAD(P)-dependent dehydrogenase (short-subunit alcohol dehydrogenase family)